MRELFKLNLLEACAIGALLLVAYVFWNIPVNATTPCSVSPTRGSATYRQIDGKRCWYPRQERPAKSDLYWAKKDVELPMIRFDPPVDIAYIWPDPPRPIVVMPTQFLESVPELNQKSTGYRMLRNVLIGLAILIVAGPMLVVFIQERRKKDRS